MLLTAQAYLLGSTPLFDFSDLLGSVIICLDSLDWFCVYRKFLSQDNFYLFVSVRFYQGCYFRVVGLLQLYYLDFWLFSIHLTILTIIISLSFVNMRHPLKQLSYPTKFLFMFCHLIFRDVSC